MRKRTLANAWIMWSQEASPLFDPEKAHRLWDRSGDIIAVELRRMGLRGLMPEDVEVAECSLGYGVINKEKKS